MRNASPEEHAQAGERHGGKMGDNDARMGEQNIIARNRALTDDIILTDDMPHMDEL